MSITGRLAKLIANYDNPQSIGSRLRARRIAPLLDLIERVFIEKGSVAIIDIGGTERYWNIVSSAYLQSRGVTITIVNLPDEPHPLDHGPFKFMGGDGCRLTGADQSYDIAHSNSVVEHVGDWSNMKAFANEVARVARCHFIQTPSYWFPIEPHCMAPFFHWLPLPIRISLVMSFQLGNWKRAESVIEAVSIVESARLLSHGMVQALFPHSQVISEKILFISKSYIAISR